MAATIDRERRLVRLGRSLFEQGLQAEALDIREFAPQSVQVSLRVGGSAYVGPPVVFVGPSVVDRRALAEGVNIAKDLIGCEITVIDGAHYHFFKVAGDR